MIAESLCLFNQQKLSKPHFPMLLLIILYKVDVTFEALVKPVTNKIKAYAKALSIL